MLKLTLIRVLGLSLNGQVKWSM